MPSPSALVCGLITWPLALLVVDLSLCDSLNAEMTLTVVGDKHNIVTITDFCDLLVL